MSYHTVSQGEHLAVIALRYGFTDWNVVYDHPENEGFRTKRPNPNVILPGDRIFIPDRVQKSVQCATDATHRFRLKQTPHCVRIVLKDADGNPIANETYKLTVGSQVYTGSTGDSGIIYREIDKKTKTAELRLDELGLGWTLQIGHLDPLHEPGTDTPIITGAKARLKNLGFYGGEVDKNFDDETRAAVARFQQEVLQRESPDGQLDSDTRLALQQQHGS